jgi:hypothetical protein
MGVPSFLRNRMSMPLVSPNTQRTQAVRVANVPASNFEAAIKGEDPATVAALAAMGTKGGWLGTATARFEDRYDAIKLP